MIPLRRVDGAPGSQQWVDAHIGKLTSRYVSKLITRVEEPPLTPEQILAIAVRYKPRSSTDGTAALSREFGVSAGLVNKIALEGLRVIPAAKLSSQADDVLWSLIAERASGKAADDFFGNQWTDRGLLLEEDARLAINLHVGADYEPCGLVLHPDRDDIGSSPDAVTADESSVMEGKAPAPKTHLRYLHEGIVPDEHVGQCQWHLWVTKRAHLLFASYCPDVPYWQKLLAVDVSPDPRWQDAFDEHIPAFLERVQQCADELPQEMNL